MTSSNTLIEQLQLLGLFVSAETITQHFKNQDQGHHNFLQVISSALADELAARTNKRCYSLLKRAKLLYTPAHLDELAYLPDRKLDRTLVERLKTGRYLHEHRNVCIFGASGTGKSFLGKALGVAACEENFRTLYIRFPALMRELAFLATEDVMKFEKRLRYYSRIPVLIIDEWLVASKKRGYSHILLDLMESRYGETTTIFCTQLAPEGWSPAVDIKAVGESILGRALANSFMIHLQGDDLRKQFSVKP